MVSEMTPKLEESSHKQLGGIKPEEVLEHTGSHQVLGRKYLPQSRSTIKRRSVTAITGVAESESMRLHTDLQEKRHFTPSHSRSRILWIVTTKFTPSKSTRTPK